MVIKESFSLLKDIVGIFKTPQGVIYMVLMVLMFNIVFSQTAAIPEEVQTLNPDVFSRLQPGSSMIIFDASSIETKDFLYSLGEIKTGVRTGINSSYNAINAMARQCSLHPKNCQAAKLSIINLESSIEKDLQTHYSLQRVCDAGEVPSSREVIWRCHAGKNWEKLSRGKRYLPPMAFQGIYTSRA